MDILFLIIGLLVGAAAGYLLAHSRTSALQERATMLAQMAQDAHDKAHADVNAAKDELRLQHDAELQRIAQQHHADLKLQQEHFEETMRRVEEQMKNATAEMLQRRQQEFAQSSNRDLGQIVTPLRETIENMRKAMNDNTSKQASMTAEMKTSMEHMLQQSAAAKQSTDELTRVFKFGNKIQGNWGETVLDELLKGQGLTPGVHYDLQPDLQGDDGTRLKPDVILHLDQNRDVVIDSKVSLSAFIEYVNAPDAAQRDLRLKEHIDSINRHVNELAKKNYAIYITPPKVRMDYVIMFVPHSGALWTALNAQPDLWRRAMEKNVFIADEQSLYAALRIVYLTWTQIKQAQNHEKVYALASEMLNRVAQFWHEYEDMGKALKKAQDAYDKGKAKIAEGGQSIGTTANKLLKLGAQNTGKNPLPALPSELD